MPSFDVVSEVDIHALTNAVDQASRVITNRYDFKGVDAAFNRSDRVVDVLAEGDFQINQMVDILRSALFKNGIDPIAMDLGKLQQSGKQVKQTATLKHGLDSQLAKKIVKLIKDRKMKVQASIQGESVRVTGKKRDDLQAVIALLKEQELDQPLQYNNFRD